jgi:hypothetical protein
MAKKIVSFEIEVPSGAFCWEYTGDNTICEFFDNEGGHETCLLGFDGQFRADTGCLKAKDCAQLKEVKS